MQWWLHILKNCHGSFSNLSLPNWLILFLGSGLKCCGNTPDKCNSVNCPSALSAGCFTQTFIYQDGTRATLRGCGNTFSCQNGQKTCDTLKKASPKAVKSCDYKCCDSNDCNKLSSGDPTANPTTTNADGSGGSGSGAAGVTVTKFIIALMAIICSVSA